MLIFLVNQKKNKPFCICVSVWETKFAFMFRLFFFFLSLYFQKLFSHCFCCCYFYEHKTVFTLVYHLFCSSEHFCVSFTTQQTKRAKIWALVWVLITLDACFLAHCCCHYYAIRCICGILIVVFFILFLSVCVVRLQSKVKKRSRSDFIYKMAGKKIKAKVDSCNKYFFCCYLQALNTPGIWHIYSMPMKNVQKICAVKTVKKKPKKCERFNKRQLSGQVDRLHYAKHVSFEIVLLSCHARRCH